MWIWPGCTEKLVLEGGGSRTPPFVLLQRKGWKKPRWEQIVVLENPERSPWHLLRHYVAQTSSLPEGSLVLGSLKPPFAPLSSDRIASITKNLLKKFGVPTAVWTAHSTRGASVQFYKNLGLTSEEVCELGQWKHTQAFTQHYLRLGAHRVASQKIKGFVHRVSQGLEAEPEGSPTPPTKDRGGRDPEGEATRNCETGLFVPECAENWLGIWGLLLLSAWG